MCGYEDLLCTCSSPPRSSILALCALSLLLQSQPSPSILIHGSFSCRSWFLLLPPQLLWFHLILRSGRLLLHPVTGPAAPRDSGPGRCTGHHSARAAGRGYGPRLRMCHASRHLSAAAVQVTAALHSYCHAPACATTDDSVHGGIECTSYAPPYLGLSRTMDDPPHPRHAQASTNPNQMEALMPEPFAQLHRSLVSVRAPSTVGNRDSSWCS